MFKKTVTQLFRKILLLGLIIILAESCKKNEPASFQNNEKNVNFISKTDATKFANSLIFKDLQGGVLKKEVKEIREITSKLNNQNDLYVINYKNGGFVVLSADNRSFPIFAVSSKNEFKFNDKNYPAGLVDWMETATEYIDKLKLSNKVQDNHTKHLWEYPDARENTLLTTAEVGSKPNASYFLPPVDPDDCRGYAKIVRPLLTTIWDQWYGYNNFTPDLGCPGHAPTGCVATAMAQIMKYHQYPNRYNWAIMPDGIGSNETSKLMSDIGSAVGMTYACDGSSADTKAAVANAFKSNFGYQSSATYIDYEGTSNYNVVTNELSLLKPVMFRGGRKRSGLTWPWNYYTEGHAWVCDGFISWSDCTISTLSLYMNWGWGGSYNGLYSFSNFNPSSYTFNYQSGVVVGIRKP